MRKWERNTPADTKVSEDRGKVLQVLLAETQGEVVPLQHMEDYSGSDSHLQPVEDPD